MKNKEFTLPTKVIAPDLEDFYRVSFYANRADEKKEDLTNVDLPKWLGDLIKDTVEHERQQAVDQFKKQVKDMFWQI
jgi:hypothetical protein